MLALQYSANSSRLLLTCPSSLIFKNILSILNLSILLRAQIQYKKAKRSLETNRPPRQKTDRRQFDI